MDKYVPRWERPQCSALAASAGAALVAPTSASAQTNYGQNRYRLGPKLVLTLTKTSTGTGPESVPELTPASTNTGR